MRMLLHQILVDNFPLILQNFFWGGFPFKNDFAFDFERWERQNAAMGRPRVKMERPCCVPTAMPSLLSCKTIKLIFSLRKAAVCNWQ